jgi:predicted O-methyltransferase YrrM
MIPAALRVLRNNEMMSNSGTASYVGVEGLPEEVSRAVQLARNLNFENSCRFEQGRLLQILAGGRQGGVIGETGTGCGVGLSWMLSATNSDTKLYSVEKDNARASACQRLFEDYSNVRIDNDDWPALLKHGPFDLLVLDGGGSGKRGVPVAIGEALTFGGTLVIDDFTPFADWPPSHDGGLDEARLHWLEHPNLLATEIRLSRDLSALVATRIW